MRIEVLFFGMLKDFAGRSGETLDLADGARVETVFDHYASQFPKLREMSDSIATAHNQEFCHLDTALADGDEVAFMPPVSGGAGESNGFVLSASEGTGFYALSEGPIDSAELARRTRGDADGAVITFEGVVRDNSNGRRTRFLDYECYRPLALKTMQRIGREILERHDVHAVSMVHRLGRMEIGEASVSIVVASAHRRPAYEASLEAINQLKKLVPVWKKEYFEDGEVWVEGQWDESIRRSTSTAS